MMRGNEAYCHGWKHGQEAAAAELDELWHKVKNQWLSVAQSALAGPEPAVAPDPFPSLRDIALDGQVLDGQKAQSAKD